MGAEKYEISLVVENGRLKFALKVVLFLILFRILFLFHFRVCALNDKMTPNSDFVGFGRGWWKRADRQNKMKAVEKDERS